MSAKEMFEELGYKLDINNEKELLYRKTCYGSIGEFYFRIWFYKDFKTFEISKRSNEIDMPLFQAINKQIEELGWNK